MDYLVWPSDQLPSRVAFISDLHLFSTRSDFPRHRWAIERAIEDAEMCVWGGDLFDFRWTRLGCETSTIQGALTWLREWLERFPSKHFVFLRGNHDSNPKLAAAVRELANESPHFWAGHDILRIANTLMLHGDLIEGRGTRASLALYRRGWESKRIAGHLQNRAYDALIRSRVHNAVAMAAHRHRATCQRLWMSLQSELHQETYGVERVVFGHTHRLIRGLKINGIEFFNGGAAIRHVGFMPVSLDIPTAIPGPMRVNE